MSRIDPAPMGLTTGAIRWIATGFAAFALAACGPSLDSNTGAESSDTDPESPGMTSTSAVTGATGNTTEDSVGDSTGGGSTGDSTTGPLQPCAAIDTEQACRAAPQCTPVIGIMWQRNTDPEGNDTHCQQGPAAFVECSTTQRCDGTDLVCAYDMALQILEGCVQLGWWTDGCQPLLPVACQKRRPPTPRVPEALETN